MAISTIRQQSQQSDCNLSNQTAISAIRIKHLATCLTPCWGPGCVYKSWGAFAISAIWLQSQQSDCNLSNQTAISAIWLQSQRIAVWLLRLQSDCWDGCLIAEIAVWFWKLVKIRGPEKEASHWLRAQNWGLWLLERTGFKKIQSIGLWFRNLSPSTHFRRQSPRTDCNLHNQTAISLIR